MTDYLLELEKPSVIFANFWLRLAALFLDGLILAPAIGVVSYLNNLGWKNLFLLALLSFTPIVYKILMEFRFGATLGKMIVKIKVVNREMEGPSMSAVLLRNIFGICYATLSFIFSLQIYLMPEYLDATTMAQLGRLRRANSYALIMVWAMIGLDIVEAIFVATDDKRRSIHDRIAGTFVIQR